MKKILITVAALLTGTVAHAQNYGFVDFYSDFNLSRMHQMSTFDTNLSTARSAAMGGAFTSLGADLSSLHINPAGLGMYRSSDFGITFGPSMSSVTNSMRGENSVTDSRTAFTVNNFGAAFNLFEGSGTTTSFSLGVGYSRLADYNYRSRMTIKNGHHSILETFDTQVIDNGQGARWGAQLALDTELLRMGSSPYYFSDVLSDEAIVLKNMNEFSRGSAGEYSFGAGWNFRNKFYFGFSLGIIDIYQKREMTYSEDYENNESAFDPVYYMDYTQYIKTIGSGYNLKLGVVYRPMPELRIGLAFHTPTVASIREYSDHYMAAGYYDEERWAMPEVEDEFEEKFYTPARLMAGVSYTFFDTGVIAIDYERSFYNGIGVYGDIYNQQTKDDFRSKVQRYFTGSDALRVGAEVMATDELALRFGYGFTRDGLKKHTIDNPFELDLPVRRESSVFSAGFGVKVGPNTSFDATYTYLDAKMTDYDMFYFDGDPALFPGKDVLDRTEQKLRRHNVMLSLSYRF